MEAPNLLENGNIPQKRKLPCCQVAFYTLIFGLITISALVSVVFCLIHHKQKPLMLLLFKISDDSISMKSLGATKPKSNSKDEALGSCWAHGSLKKPSTPNLKDVMSWEWNFEHCNGFVQKDDDDEYLVIEQSGNYFIYAQINRKQHMEVSFTLMMYKEPDILLNKVVGPKEGDERGTVNFGRPFFLQKGDKLYCQGNFNLNYILEGNQTYWGLYKI